MKLIKNALLILTLLKTPYVLAQNVETKSSSELTTTINTPNKEVKKEVIDNPTLKNLSGALNNYSFYSRFTYKGGSLADPLDAKRPNITNSAKKPTLQNLTGQIGGKYRMTESDNLSLQIGISMTTPFHSSIDTEDSSLKKEFDENHQKLEFDNPRISYFKTYTLGPVQNVSFLTVEKFTQDVYRDYGYDFNFQVQHALALRISKAFYVATTLFYQQNFFDKYQTYYPKYKRNISLENYQIQRAYKASLSLELYLSKSLALRGQTDLVNYEQLINNKFQDVDEKELQQLVAFSYYFNRDISISPSATFIYKDIRKDKTNLGLNVYLNL